MDLYLELQILAKHDLSIEQYTIHLKSILDNLFAIGESISEKDIMLYGFNGLDACYNTIIKVDTISTDAPSIVMIACLIIIMKPKNNCFL